MPEREQEDAPWTIALSLDRVSREQMSVEVGHGPLAQLLKQRTLLWADHLCVLEWIVPMRAKGFSCPLWADENLVVIARVRSNRVFYQIVWPLQTGTSHYDSMKFANDARQPFQPWLCSSRSCSVEKPS